ncbi:MAG: hypothetical protein NC433_12485 [Clostridiales bacterium]|nr:hypothetical protein [Clostridiales bacterium]MCM1262848.1 hypothetical protein [Butyrivibrio sp.]
MRKKIVSVLLSLTMVVGLLTGCGGGDNNASSGTTGDSQGNDASSASLLPADDESKTIEFSTWMYADDYKHYTTYDENPVVKCLNEMFNVEMTYQLPAMGAEAENFQVMIGTGDYTDIMNTTYSSDSMSSLYEDGVIIDIAPYLEEYMPNYYALIQADEELRKLVYDDEGHAFGIYFIEDQTRNQWGGLAYRRDILETMTGGNVQFPSGNENPVTVEDWDYMLPLMKQYFDASGMTDTACLIIPACGYITSGELSSGFGTGAIYQLASDGKTVEFGAATDNFYNYLQKMHEWYEAGYVYQDFASRTNDMFYLPNPALTYGGAAGVWFALLEQVGDVMSMPDYGLNVDVVPITAPLDTEHGITEADAGFYIFNGVASNPFCISSACDENKLARIFKVMDYLYSEEGKLLRAKGLNAEQAASDELYQQYDIPAAYYYDENGNFCVNEKLLRGDDYDIKAFSFYGERLPGLSVASDEYVAFNLERTANDDAQDNAGDVWVKYGRDRVFPGGATLNTEESTKYTSVATNIFDYVDTMVPKFIMGTEELTEESWQAYLDQLDKLGLDTFLEAEQSAYDRYLAR